MRKINLLFLLLAIPSISFTSKEQNSFFSITSFEIEISQDNKYVTITNRFSSSLQTNYYYIDLSWNVSCDGNEKYLGYVRLSNFKVTDNIEVPTHPKIDIANLGIDNEFILYVYASDTRVTTKESLHFNIKGKTNVTFQEKDNDVGVSSGYIVESRSIYDESKNFIKEDRVIFSNYEDIIVEDYYLNFDIRRFKYLYRGKNDAIDGSFYLLIYDKYNLFIDLPIYKDSQYRYVELAPSIFNGDSVFSFKNIYYNPLTHNTSTIDKEGYIQTDKLYFPIGQLEKLKSIHCLLSFDIKGYTNFNMSSEFDIYFLKNYFGDCSNSEYCINMNTDEGNNVREKVIDISL